MNDPNRLPDPFTTLRHEGWPAVEGPYREYAAGRITYERALADTLAQVVKDWRAFWHALRRIAPGLAHELGKTLGGERLVAFTPPLAPDNLNGVPSCQ